jgi:hypothetical protein
MAKDGNVELRMGVDASGVVHGVAVAQGALGKLQTQLAAMESMSGRAFSLSGMAGIGLSATAAAAALVGSVKAAADYGDQLDNMSQRTGVAVEELARLQYAAKLSDTSTEALGKGVGNLSKLMVGAAAGGAESSKLFERFGISLRNADGTIRSTTEVLYDLADVFSVMPEGPEKTTLAMDFFGKKLGQELIPLLNQGSTGLRAMADEAERLGLVLSAGQARKAAEFNDNLDRMSALSKSVGMALGNWMIPGINNMLSEIDAATKSSEGFIDSFLKTPFVLAEFQKARDAADNIERLTEQIDALRAKLADGRSDSIYGFDDGSKAKLEKLEAERSELQKLQGKQQVNEDSETAAKRLAISNQLAREVASLEQLKAIAAGKASSDILKSDKERTDEQIKNAEKLRGALQSAWETSRKEAQKAAEDAQKLLDKAAGVRTSASDKAAELRNSGLSDEEKQVLAYSQAQDAQGQGSFYAAAAGAAQLDGRSKDFEKYQKQAESFLDRAMKFAEASGSADMIEAVGNAQAGVIEKNAKAKQNEASALEAQATAQAESLAKLDTDIEALKKKAANIAISADISQAEGAVAALQKKLDELPASKTVTVTMQTIAAEINSAGMGGFARGGLLRGPGTATSDSIMARLSDGEFVVRAAAVNHYGSGLLSRINSMQIPRFADGGMVGGSVLDRLDLPSLSSQAGPAAAARQSARTPVVLDFGKLGRFQTEAPANIADEITKVFQRAALSHGGR